MTTAAAGMPPDVKQVFDELFQEVAWLHAFWKTYCQMYDDKDNLDVLNDTAPAFFKITEYALRVAMVMGICRLADPVSSVGRDNLNFARLEQMFSSHALDPAFKAAFTADLQA